ncbi:MAG: hypothetical protein JWQ69_1614 [Pseudomonas sp.]|nr:hypothetical protein [Pseudomonas sp.]
MTTFHSLTLSRAAFALLLAMSPLLSQAADEVPIDMSAVQLVPQQQNGISYLSGGIGIDETEAIQQTKGYNLHLTFSAGPSNEYVPNIDVVIQTEKGQPVVSMNQVGPITYVKLPAGKYTVVSTRNGQEKQERIEVDGGSVRTVNFHWTDMGG